MAQRMKSKTKTEKSKRTNAKSGKKLSRMGGDE